MNTAVINIKIEPSVKKQAQKVVEDLGLTLSSAINAFLKNLIRSKTINFSLNENPSPYLMRQLKKSKEDIKKGRVVSFEDPKKAIEYIGNINYQNEKRKNR